MAIVAKLDPAELTGPIVEEHARVFMRGNRITPAGKKMPKSSKRDLAKRHLKSLENVLKTLHGSKQMEPLIQQLQQFVEGEIEPELIEVSATIIDDPDLPTDAEIDAVVQQENDRQAAAARSGVRHMSMRELLEHQATSMTPASQDEPDAPTMAVEADLTETADV